MKKAEPMRAALDVERKPGSLTWLGFLNVKRPRWIIGWTGKRRWMFFDFWSAANFDEFVRVALTSAAEGAKEFFGGDSAEKHGGNFFGDKEN